VRPIPSRDFLNKHFIRYPNIYINEDGAFNEILKSYKPKDISLSDIQYKYNKNVFSRNIGNMIDGKYISILL
jgi:hypothetical protein